MEDGRLARSLVRSVNFGHAVTFLTACQRRTFQPARKSSRALSCRVHRWRGSRQPRTCRLRGCCSRRIAKENCSAQRISRAPDNNFAEYQGLIAALEYAVANGHKAL